MDRDEISMLRDEIERHDGIVECTPRNVAALITEIKRLRSALRAIEDGTDEQGLLIGSGEMQEIATRALEPKLR